MVPLNQSRAGRNRGDIPDAVARTIYAECVKPYLAVIRSERIHFDQTVIELLADKSYQAAYYEAWTRCCSTIMSVISWTLISTLLRAAADPGSSLRLRESDGDQVGAVVRFSDGSEVLITPSIKDIVRIMFRHQEYLWCPPPLHGPSPLDLSHHELTLEHGTQSEKHGAYHGTQGSGG